MSFGYEKKCNRKGNNVQEKQWDGKDILTNDPKLEDFLKGMNKVENKFVALHKPGSDVKLSDGTKYRVNKNGAWKKI